LHDGYYYNIIPLGKLETPFYFVRKREPNL